MLPFRWARAISKTASQRPSRPPGRKGSKMDQELLVVPDPVVVAAPNRNGTPAAARTVRGALSLRRSDDPVVDGLRAVVLGRH